MLHDEDVFPEPDSFRPERFLATDGSLRDDIPYPIEAFGFGRRICPGRFFAHDLMWITIANILAVFTIGPPVGKDGKTQKVNPDFTPRFLR